MTDPNPVTDPAHYGFTPWLRRGLAARITRTEDALTEASTSRAVLDATVTVNGTTTTPTSSLTLFGPEDVKNLDPRVVIRTWPKADVLDAEPNYFPLLELDQPDLPWRYTPAAASGTTGRLRPWLCLIVLKDDEYKYTPASNTGSAARLPTVNVLRATASLPDLTQSWAFAHAYVQGQDPITEELITQDPHRVVARLLCPRKLDARTSYTAFLVPAFERGRLAGLGQDVTGTPMQAAWSSASNAAVLLPVYYQWRFGTGAEGDFESLVQRLQPRPVPPTVGTRPMDVGAPGLDLPAANDQPLALEGALMAPTTAPSPWDSGHRTGFVGALATLTNAPAGYTTEALAGDKPVVAPPLYGRWLAAKTSLDPAATPAWFEDLNEDPRARVAAGLGTLVVQSQQTQLMAGAWGQLPKIRAINETLRFAQLSREGADRIYNRHFKPMSAGPLLQLTAAVHGRVLNGATTVRAQTRGSAIEGVLEPAFRRIARLRGPMRRRQQRNNPVQQGELLTRLNNGTVAAARVPAPVTNVATPLNVAAVLAPLATPAQLATPYTNYRDQAYRTPFPATFLFGLGAGKPTVTPALYGSPPWSSLINDMSDGHPPSTPGIVDAIVGSIPPRYYFTPKEYTPNWTPPDTTVDTDPTHQQDSTAAAAFRQALKDLFDNLAVVPPAAQVPAPLDLPALAAKVLDALNPRDTIPARFQHGLHFDTHTPSGIAWAPTDPLEPVLAAPEFEQPMYAPLRDLSQDWLLPGLDQVPADTVTLLKTNQRFVEAYMVGLSHEMSRELIWNEYPTDQRATYFRQFWDPGSYLQEDGTAPAVDDAKDITPIQRWGANDALGTHSPRGLAEEHVVLLVRGELLRRYPTATVYATKFNPSGSVPDGTDPSTERHPVFRGTMAPDVTFLGFDLTVDEMLNPGGSEAWYFVIQEHGGEPRFGLEPGAEPPPSPPDPPPPPPSRDDWSELAWDAVDVTVDGAHFLNLTASTLPSPLHSTDDAARFAQLAFRRPVRIVIPASQLLPTT